MRYIERETLAAPTRQPLVATHPAAPDRLARLQALLPWAERLHRARPGGPWRRRLTVVADIDGFGLRSALGCGAEGRTAAEPLC